MQNKNSIRLFLVTDRPLLVSGFEHLVSGTHGSMKVVGTVKDLAAAMKQVAKTPADVVIVDLDLGEGAINAIPRLLEHSKARVLALSALNDPTLQDRAILAGARGVIDQRLPLDTIGTAIRRVHEGEIWLDRAATGRIFVEFSRRAGEAVDPDRRKIETLTERERQIIVAARAHPAANAKEIAALLHISESTFRNHLTSIYGKLGLTNRVELYAFTQKHELR